MGEFLTVCALWANYSPRLPVSICLPPRSRRKLPNGLKLVPYLLHVFCRGETHHHADIYHH